MSDLLLELTNSNILGWYLYGVIMAGVMWTTLGVKAWYGGRDFTLEDLLIVLVSTCLGWLWLAIIAGNLLFEVFQKRSVIVLKGRKQPKGDDEHINANDG